MDDSCAVCAETLEWVAYGSCGHKDVCSTCVARLRFICDDRRCCICKSESPVIFITKALGDYTRMINDFSFMPSGAKEGRAGSYWYHEDTQAFVDDSDHYKMIKAMCRLSCSVCDRLEDQGNDGPKRRARFRNIDQLKGHLFHQHRLLMCSLCLEGRKVFICEQKLYSKAQLKQHISTGDSEVDGTESERGGFMGHPLCEFCRSPFYGDNELYTHMSTEHYTCHICQRQHPGQYEYYKNYDDLEIHFRHEHFLCEDESCLRNKFVVFQSEAEMKRHNALEHGGRMSRAQRNAALQIPTSFRYRRSNEQDNRRGRGRTFRRDVSDAELSRAIEASFETASLDSSFHDSLSSNVPVISEGQMSDINPIIQPFESLATSDFEPPSRYLQALSHVSMNRRLEESSFPPLPLAPGSSQLRPMSDQEGLQKNTMAENLRGKNKKKVPVVNPVQPDSAQAWPVAGRVHVAQAVTPAHSRPNVNSNPGSSLMSTQSKPAINQTQSRYSSSVQKQHASVNELSSAGTLTSLSNWGSTNRISHSTSAPNLVEVGSSSDFPPVSAAQIRKQPVNRQAVQKVEDAYTANNKSMVEKIRVALEFDQDKYAAFKDISGEYRQGLIDAETYLAHVEQFRLSHLILDLARLCPDPQKERELIAAYNATQVNRGSQENGWPSGTKGKYVTENSSSKDNLADSILSKVRELQSNYKQPEEEVETLSKEGYRAAKGKSKVGVDGPKSELNSPNLTILKAKGESNFRFDGGGSNRNSGDGDGRSKQRKKTSKFNRVCLGDGSLAALIDPNPSLDPGPESVKSASDGNKDSEGLPVRGVWKNGGGHRLLTMTSKDPKN